METKTYDEWHSIFVRATLLLPLSPRHLRCAAAQTRRASHASPAPPASDLAMVWSRRRRTTCGTRL